MSTPAVDELTRFIANPAPEPITRQFGVLYCEVLNLVRLAMIPGGWLPDPTAFQPGSWYKDTKRGAGAQDKPQKCSGLEDDPGDDFAEPTAEAA